jgi:hypothetical protein
MNHLNSDVYFSHAFIVYDKTTHTYYKDNVLICKRCGIYFYGIYYENFDISRNGYYSGDSIDPISCNDFILCSTLL